MSQENVEVAIAFFQAWSAGNMDALRELHDPNAIARPPEGWPEPGPFVGQEPIMRQFEQLRETWDADALELISDFIDAGDRVAVRYIWRGAGHGPNLNMELTIVFTMRKGRIFYMEYFWDHSEALETLGISDEAMSQENVEIVRLFIDQVNSDRDWESAGARFMSDDIEIDWSRSPAPYRGIYRGREAALRFSEELNIWEDARLEPKDFINAGDDVLVPHVVHLRGRDGIEVAVRATYVYTLRNGLIVRWRIYQDHADALEAVGLSE